MGLFSSEKRQEKKPEQGYYCPSDVWDATYRNACANNDMICVMFDDIKLLLEQNKELLEQNKDLVERVKRLEAQSSNSRSERLPLSVAR